MLAVFVPCVSSPLDAQIVQGVVLEATARAPIAGAAVELRGPGSRVAARTVSDSLGIFALTPPRAGTYTLRATHTSYVTHEADTVRVGATETVTVEVRMDQTVIPLAPLVVTARTPGWLGEFEARRRAGGFGKFLTREEITARGASNTSDLLRTTPGVVVTAQRRGNSSLVQMRSTVGMCQPAIWIDGIFIAQFPGGTTLDDVLHPSSIDAAEVYTSVSAAPVQYRSGSCGVLLFWTKRGSRGDGEPFKWKKVALGLGAAVLFIILVR